MNFTIYGLVLLLGFGTDCLELTVALVTTGFLYTGTLGGGTGALNVFTVPGFSSLAWNEQVIFYKWTKRVKICKRLYTLIIKVKKKNVLSDTHISYIL